MLFPVHPNTLQLVNMGIMLYTTPVAVHNGRNIYVKQKMNEV
jgi:hypothetical protein